VKFANALTITALTFLAPLGSRGRESTPKREVRSVN
jgi:hypothetical protein